MKMLPCSQMSLISWTRWWSTQLLENRCKTRFISSYEENQILLEKGLVHAMLIFLWKADFIILSFSPDKHATKEEVAHFKCTKEQPGYIYIYICTSETEARATECFENVTALLPAWNVCLNNWVMFRLEWIFSIILYLFAPALPARLHPLSCAPEVDVKNVF